MAVTEFRIPHRNQTGTFTFILIFLPEKFQCNFSTRFSSDVHTHNRAVQKDFLPQINPEISCDRLHLLKGI